MAKLTNFIKDYKEFIANYIFPLIGHPFQNEFLCNKKDNDETVTHLKVKKDKNKLYFYIPQSRDYIIANLRSNISDDIVSLVNTICEQYGKVAKFSYIDGSSRQNDFSKIERNRIYNYAVQLGICYWICENGSIIEELLSILEEWSLKTYEGRNISYSIIVDINKENIVEKNDFFKFLRDEYSATLTDSITSAFLMDLNGNLIKYVSIVDEKNTNYVNKYKLPSNVPLRFANLIYKEVFDKRIGIFLLSNGDILISKKGEIILIKRNGKWFNCQFSSFDNALLKFRKKNKIKKQLIKEIFSTILDVSFSHTGGLISVLINDEYLNGDNQIIDLFEQLNEDLDENALRELIKSSNKLLNDNEIKNEAGKRKVKKEAILKLLGDNKYINFVDIERKLRSELSALDGAFILNKEGNLIAVGTIIQNDKGSSGGGRSSAAKKLSLNGLAIKISTDGYIETFVNGVKVYSIK